MSFGLFLRSENGKPPRGGREKSFGPRPWGGSWLALGVIGALALLFLALVALQETALAEARRSRAQVYEVIRSRFLKSDGMVEVEPGKATSEGQSYLMIMAVGEDDRVAFENVWRWTKANMQTRGDHLFSWLLTDGKIRDPSSATDADQDIAFALAAASRKWNAPSYLIEARGIMADIWDKDTRVVAGMRYVGAGDWVQRDPGGAVLNPSYFAPYLYRVFSREDPGREWQALVDSSYYALERCVFSPGMAKDWCKVDPLGSFVAATFPDGRNVDDNSFEALRVPFRLALDYRRSGERRAFDFLRENRRFSEDWARDGKIYAVYGAGESHADYETLARYGATLPLFAVTDSPLANQIFFKKIKPLPENIGSTFYDLSWAWFGLSFFTDSFPDPGP